MVCKMPGQDEDLLFAVWAIYETVLPEVRDSAFPQYGLSGVIRHKKSDSIYASCETNLCSCRSLITDGVLHYESFRQIDASVSLPSGSSSSLSGPTRQDHGEIRIKLSMCRDVLTRDVWFTSPT